MIIFTTNRIEDLAPMGKAKYYHVQITADSMAKSLNRLKDSTNAKINEIIRNHFGLTIRTADKFNVVVGWDSSSSKYLVKKISIPRNTVSSKRDATMEAYILGGKIDDYLKKLSDLNQKP